MPIQFKYLNLPPPYIRFAAPDENAHRALLKVVLDNRKKLPGNAKNRVTDLLKQVRLREGGFRDGLQAPTPVLLNNILPSLFLSGDENDTAITTFWDAWTVHKKSLHAALTEYLDERDFALRDVQAGDPKAFTAAWHIDEVEHALADFDLNTVDDNVTPTDVRMMFCWLTDIAALPDEEMQAVYENVRQTPDFAASPWGAWLTQFESLPDDAPAWEHIPALLDYLAQLNQHTQPLHTPTRERARQALIAFAESLNTKQRTYYALRDALPNWTVDHLPTDELNAATELLADIRDSITLYERKLRQEDNARDITARRELRDEIRELETHIVEALEAANNQLHPPADATVTLPTPPALLAETFTPHLNEILDHPATHPLWQELPVFIALLQELNYQHQQRVPDTDAPLAEKLQELVALGTDTLNEFDLNTAVDWNADNIPADKTAEITHIIDQMLGAIAQYTHLNQQRPTSFEERRQVIHQKGDVADRIQHLKSTLQDIFEAASHPPAIPDTNADQPGPPPLPRLDETAAPPDDTVPITAESDVAAPPPLTEADSPLPPTPLPPGDLAAALTDDTPVDALADWLWSLIEYGDLPAAYWLAKSLYEQGHIPPVPRELIASLQGSHWLSADFDQGAATLSSIASEYTPDTTRPADVMLSVAAALRTAPLAPVSGVTDWLRTPDNVTALHPIIEALQELATYNIAIQPETVDAIAHDVQQATQAQVLMDEAAEWLETAPRQRNKLLRAEKIWQHLVRPGGDLYNMLDTVIHNRSNQRQTIIYQLEKFADSQLDALIDDLDRQLNGAGVAQIVGTARKQLKRDINYANHFARRWLNLTAANNTNRSRDWQLEQVRMLRERIQAAYPAVVTSLQTLTADDQPRWQRASAWSLRRALDSLVRLLSLGRLIGDAPAVPRLPRPWDQLRDPATGLLSNLELRLLWLPGLPLNNDGSLAANGLNDLPRVLRTAYTQNWQTPDVIRHWLQQQDFRFTNHLIALVDPPQADQLRQRAAEERAGVMRALRERIASASEDIERALIDGVIGEKKRTDLIAQTAIDVETVKHFDPLFDQLNRLSEQLRHQRETQLAALRQSWDDLHTSLKQHPDDNTERVITRMKTVLQTQDIRLIRETLKQARRFSETGQLDPGWLVELENEQSTVLEDYLNAQESLELELQRSGVNGVINKLERRGRFANLNYRPLDQARRQSAIQALSQWREMKEKQTKRTDGHPARLRTLLQFIGFNIDHADSITQHNHGDDWLHYHVLMSALPAQVRPIPSLGSRAGQHYDVICIWDRPDVSTLSGTLHQLQTKSKTVIVLYFARMGQTRWQDVIDISREQNKTLAVLDETLFVYLTARGPARLRDFVRCALPFTAAMPYTADQPTDHPPEMFFGRDDLLQRLQAPTGGNLVFGGRGLGKSALLHAAQSQFHDPKREQYAWVTDIHALGHKQPVQSLWVKLIIGLQKAGLAADNSPDDPQSVQRTIHDALNADDSRRILVLFDNADNFLNAESESNPAFPVTAPLHRLMTETHHRFKIVFAGMHRVQRYQHQPNQPLATHGQPIRVDVLRPADAQQLIRQPLETLGYRIKSSSVLRILTYTNYHPGLIQLFCTELIQFMHSKQINRLPPYEITQQDVEHVYLRQSVRQRISERFGRTLALDRRYQAITWSLIVTQDEPLQAYPPQAIERLVRLYWAEGFTPVSSDHFRALLNEMVGMGILVRNKAGQYRLHDPNLVRLMGSEQDIETKLLQLAGQPPPSQNRRALTHVLLNTGQYSPLTRAQERLLMQPSHGRALIFTTRALGSETLPATLAHPHPPTPHPRRNQHPRRPPNLHPRPSDQRHPRRTLSALSRPQRPAGPIANRHPRCRPQCRPNANRRRLVARRPHHQTRRHLPVQQPQPKPTRPLRNPVRCRRL